MRQIAIWITKALEQRNDDAALERIRRKWPSCQPFPALCVAAVEVTVGSYRSGFWTSTSWFPTHFAEEREMDGARSLGVYRHPAQLV